MSCVNCLTGMRRCAPITAVCCGAVPGRPPGPMGQLASPNWWPLCFISKLPDQVSEQNRLIVLNVYLLSGFFWGFFPFDCCSGPAPFLSDSPASRPVPLPCGVHQRYPMDSSMLAETVLRETLPGQLMLPLYRGQRNSTKCVLSLFR